RHIYNAHRNSVRIIAHNFLAVHTSDFSLLRSILKRVLISGENLIQNDVHINSTVCDPDLTNLHSVSRLFIRDESFTSTRQSQPFTSFTVQASFVSESIEHIGRLRRLINDIDLNPILNHSIAQIDARSSQ